MAGIYRGNSLHCFGEVNRHKVTTQTSIIYCTPKTKCLVCLEELRVVDKLLPVLVDVNQIIINTATPQNNTYNSCL